MTNTERLAEALRLAREWFNHLEADEGPQAHEVIAAADAALAAHESSQQADHEAAAEPAGEAVPTEEDINAQDWAGMDGTTAFLLIERHGEDWSHIGRLMNAWLAANKGPAAPAAEPLTWKQFTAACAAEYGEDFAPEEFVDVPEGQKEELMRVVRMVERAHGIGASGGEVQK